MNLINFLSYIFIFFGCYFFFKKRSYRFLRYFQQEEYNSSRFIAWIWKNRAFDTKGSISILSCIVFTYFSQSHLITALAGFTALLWIPKTEEDPLKDGKVRLKMTERATQIVERSIQMFGFVLVSSSLVLLWKASFINYLFFQLLFFQFCPLFLVLSKLTLNPSEKKKQNLYLKEAKELLQKFNPYIIGITGSYGKTSTKQALSYILQTTLGPTFLPQKGINTPMGITREIRMHLKEGYRFGVIEMGAYSRGSIARLCDLTPPDAAIITAIGSAHLNRFGSQENILLGKSELAAAVPENGILICNGDDLGCRTIAEKYPKKTVLFYGFDHLHLDVRILKWQMSVEGMHFEVSWKEKTYQGFCPLFGKHALSNVIAAWSMACALGSDPEFALGAIRNLTPVDNRLNIQRVGKILYLHDAYNSNPAGFSSALDVLSALPSERKILMTPGMVELGHLQDNENEKIGEKISHICDLALIVGHTNKASLLRGLKKGGFNEQKIIFCENREIAFAHLDKIRRDGDSILIENDLTDIYEQKISF